MNVRTNLPDWNDDEGLLTLVDAHWVEQQRQQHQQRPDNWRELYLRDSNSKRSTWPRPVTSGGWPRCARAGTRCRPKRRT